MAKYVLTLETQQNLFGQFCRRKFDEESTAELRKAIETQIGRIDKENVDFQSDTAGQFKAVVRKAEENKKEIDKTREHLRKYKDENKKMGKGDLVGAWFAVEDQSML